MEDPGYPPEFSFDPHHAKQHAYAHAAMQLVSIWGQKSFAKI